MEILKQKLTKFLTTNNSWILVVTMIFISFIKLMSFRESDYFGGVYWHPDKWILLFKLIGSLLLIFSPLLLFAYFRSRILNKLSGVGHTLIWISLFILYPIILVFTKVADYLIPVRMETEVVTIIGVLLGVIELISQPKHKFTLNINYSWLKSKFSTEWLVIIIYLVLNLQILYLNNTDEGLFFLFLQAVLETVVIYIFYYINHHFLINRVYKNKGLIYYLFSFLGLIMLFYLPMATLFYYLPGYKVLFHYNDGKYWIGPDAPLAFWSFHGSSITSLMILSIPLTILAQWIDQQKKIISLQKEKSETELNLLKQQINPHFFFNTLNNVYSMSLTKNEQTPAAIQKLSELMRYVIYKGKENQVPLLDEMQYIKDFLALQKMRMYQSVDIQFDIDIINKEQTITPLLYIILVENAFKHGIESADQDGYIHISLQENEGYLHFTCTNSIESTNEKSTDGVGLENLKQRLDLLYPDRHTLSHEIKKDAYIAKLRIKNI